MLRSPLGLLLSRLAVLSVGVAAGVAAQAPGEEVRFARDIRPILGEHCLPCHGPDAGARKGKLRLDLRDEAVARGVLTPDPSGQSPLVRRITHHDPGQRMPPAGQRPLTLAQVALLLRWVAQGAEYSAHWAFIPPERPPVPAVRNRAWVKNPIDAFVLSRLEAAGLVPSPAADRATLLRRASLDLLGLPPAPQDVAAFVADPRADAFETWVERLLASPHHGERMAVAWLDVARFADTVGFHGDQGQNVFPYRDWVIEAFQSNLPFDQFTRDQLAGDLLPEPTESQRVATGFLRLNMMTREGGAQPGEYLVRYTADRVRTVAGAWLGVTLGCAECHDHKMDPFTSRDFYRLGAFFADLKQWGVYQDYPYTPNPDLKDWSNDHPFPPELQVRSPALLRRMATLRERIRAVAAQAAESLGTDPERNARFMAWREESRAALATHRDGWERPVPRVRAVTRDKNTPPPPVQGVATLPDGRVVLGETAPTALELELVPDQRRLAAVRIEYLPHGVAHGRSLRKGQEGQTLRLSAAVGPPGGTSKPVAFGRSDASAKDPLWFNGHELVGLRRGWRPARALADQTQWAVWIADPPVTLAPSEVLTVKLEGCGAASLSVSVSAYAPAEPLLRPWDEARLLALSAEAPGPDQQSLLAETWLRSTAADAALAARLRSLDASLAACDGGVARTLVAERSDAPLPCRVLPRGNWQDQSGEAVTAGVPDALPQPAAFRGRALTRLDLAAWLTSPEHPLTARVFVNRLWQLFFGTGLSAVVDDLGTRGEFPSHPELLDWLAVEFRESGWDVRHMVRLLVTSATWRQVSNPRPEHQASDPQNRLLTSQNPRRLDAEFVRDNALAIAGLLNREVGGPSCTPYQPPGYYRNLQFPDRDYQAVTDDRQYRRGLYMHWQRTFLHPMLAAFDAPSREECTPARAASNTPQQALTLLNDPTFVEAARAFAGAVLAEPGDDPRRLAVVFGRALARAPQARESETLLRYLEQERQGWEARPEDRAKFLKVGLLPAPAGVDPVELAAWTSLCRVVLNLHETITRY